VAKLLVTLDASGIQPLAGRPPSGILRTTLELIRSLLGIEDVPCRVSLFSQRLRGERLQAYGFQCQQRHLPLPRSAWVGWLTRRLPIIETVCGCDLFHAPSNWAPVHRTSRTVVTIHDALFFAYPEEHLRHSLERLRIPPLAQRAAAVVTPSEASKRDIVRFMQVAATRVHVIPWGVRHDHFRPDENTPALAPRVASASGIAGRYFLSVSCDIGRKNSERVLECFLRSCNQYPEDLVLVWRRPPERVRERLRCDRNSRRVHLVDSVSDEELRDLYAGATALLFPSFYEGFGLPVLESMACGTPVITSPVSSLPEVGGEAALYVKPDSEAEIIDAMKALACSPGLRRELSAKSVAQAARFTWEKCARRTVAVYLECLARQRNGG
jgi:glycosyltransferase involved in cell wall biosynthesis